MSLNANNSGNAGSGGGIQAVEPGTYPARLVVVADLGLQKQRPYQGQDKPPAFEILTTYELVDEFLQGDDGEDMPDKPRWVSEQFPLYSLDTERAKSTARYNGIDPSHEYEGDWNRLLNMPCLVTLVQNPGKDGKVFTNITHVAPMRAKEVDSVPELVNEALSFDMSDPDLYVFHKLPQFVQDKITNGLEYDGSDLESNLSSGTTQVKDAVEDDDEKPY